MIICPTCKTRFHFPVAKCYFCTPENTDGSRVLKAGMYTSQVWSTPRRSDRDLPVPSKTKEKTMRESVKIVIDKHGRIVVEAMGTEGPACLAMVDPFVRALGGKSEFEHKPEFTRSPDVTRNQEAEAGQ